MQKEIHIWRIEARNSSNRPDTVLNREELDRMQCFRAPRHGCQWASFRSGMRHILAGYLQIPPGDIHFCNQEHGKLSVRERPNVHFNLSHSGAVGLLSVTALAPIGVDVEHQRPVSDMDGVIDLVFTSQERANLEALAPEQRDVAFYDLWTCKEAVMKACGMGLHLEPDSFDIGVQCDRTTASGWQSVHAPAAAGQDRHFWLTRLEVGPGYKGAVALEISSSTPFQPPLVRYFDVKPASASRPNPAIIPQTNRRRGIHGVNGC